MRLKLSLVAACASIASLAAMAAPAANEESPAMQDECGNDAAAGAAPQEKGAAETECVTAPDDAARDARAYWTPERMRNAKPLPTPVIDPETMKPVEPE